MPKIPKKMTLFEARGEPSEREKKAAAFLAEQPVANRAAALALYEPELRRLAAACATPAKEGHAELAALVALYDEMRAVKVPPTLDVINLVLAQLAPHGRDRAFATVERDIKLFRHQPNLATYHSRVRLYGRVSRPKLLQTWAEARDAGLLRDAPAQFWVDLIDAIGRKRSTRADFDRLAEDLAGATAPRTIHIDTALIEAMVRSARYRQHVNTSFESDERAAARRALLPQAIAVLESAEAAARDAAAKGDEAGRAARQPSLKTYQTFLSQYALLGHTAPECQFSSAVLAIRSNQRKAALTTLAPHDHQRVSEFIAKIKAAPLAFP